MYACTTKSRPPPWFCWIEVPPVLKSVLIYLTAGNVLICERKFIVPYKPVSPMKDHWTNDIIYLLFVGGTLLFLLKSVIL